MSSETIRVIKEFLQEGEGESLRQIREYLKRDSDPLRYAKVIWRFGAPICRLNGTDRYQNFNDWVADFSAWKDQFTIPTHQVTPNRPHQVLYELWSVFEQQVRRSVSEENRNSKMLPQEGGVLAFVDSASKCLICSYRIAHGGIAKVTPVAVVDGPQSLFDIWSTIDTVSSPSTQNFLKSILTSGHKIVFHRGSLVHVDRRHDTGVFGPTIDTVVAAEAIAELVSTDWGERVRTTLEVGCGNGLISSVLLQNANHITHHIALDIDLASIICTDRNLQTTRRNFPARTGNSPPLISLVVSPFEQMPFATKVDLCVCNPPYIPELVGTVDRDTDQVTRDNRRATGGTDLMVELIRSAPTLLTETGKLVIVTTHMSIAELKAAVPSGYTSRELGPTREVNFDVEADVSDPQWLNYLTTERALISRKSHFYHRLHVVEISRSMET